MSTEARETVVNTNTLITPDQFQLLKDSFGKPVNFHYRYKQVFSDEEPSVEDNITEGFVLDDFHFFTKPETDEKYLAFFDSKEEKWFPYFESENAFSDMAILQCSKLTDAVGNVLWSFDNPQKIISVRINDHLNSRKVQDIKDEAESAKSFLRKKAQGEYVDRVEEIQERANYESSIGNLPSHMADYYDNEVRVDYQTLRKSEEENK